MSGRASDEGPNGGANANTGTVPASATAPDARTEAAAVAGGAHMVAAGWAAPPHAGADSQTQAAAAAAAPVVHGAPRRASDLEAAAEPASAGPGVPSSGSTTDPASTDGHPSSSFPVRHLSNTLQISPTSSTEHIISPDADSDNGGGAHVPAEAPGHAAAGAGDGGGDAADGASQTVAGRIYIGNLPWSYDDARLAAEFSHIGPVTRAQIIFDRDTNRSKGFGFVTFGHHEHAERAITEMHGTVMGGREIKVNKADAIGTKPRVPRTPSPGSKRGRGGGGRGSRRSGGGASTGPGHVGGTSRPGSMGVADGSGMFGPALGPGGAPLGTGMHMPLMTSSGQFVYAGTPASAYEMMVMQHLMMGGMHQGVGVGSATGMQAPGPGGYGGVTVPMVGVGGGVPGAGPTPGGPVAYPPSAYSPTGSHPGPSFATMPGAGQYAGPSGAPLLYNVMPDGSLSPTMMTTVSPGAVPGGGGGEHFIPASAAAAAAMAAATYSYGGTTHAMPTTAAAVTSVATALPGDPAWQASMSAAGVAAAGSAGAPAYFLPPTVAVPGAAAAYAPEPPHSVPLGDTAASRATTTTVTEAMPSVAAADAAEPGRSASTSE